MEAPDLIARRVSKAVDLAEAAAILSSRDEILAFITAHIHEIIPCDKAAMNECDLVTGEVLATAMDDQPTSFPIPLRLNHRETPLPLLTYFESTRRLEGARLSDVSPANWRDSASYSEVYRPMGAEHQAGVILEYHDSIAWGVALNRSTADFADSDLMLLSILGSIMRPNLTSFSVRQGILDLLARKGAERSLITFDGGWERVLDVPAVASDLLGPTDYASNLPGFNRLLGDLARTLDPLVPRRVGSLKFTRLPQSDPGRGSLLVERSNQSDLLTERQREILEFIDRGLSAKAIAQILGISRRTVETHLQNAYARLKVNNRVQAVNGAGIRVNGI